MSEIPYTPLTGKIKEYFDKIQEVGVPTNKVTNKWLKDIGFKSGNDAYLLSILKYINFLDSSGYPTENWKQYKDTTKAKSVLAQAIQQSYKELFELYSDAHRKDREAIYAFFSSKSGKAKRTVDKMVKTFTNLCQIADFESLSQAIPEKAVVVPQVKELAEPILKKGLINQIHVNIQLHLPATNDSTVYDNLFKSLKKHLLSEEE